MKFRSDGAWWEDETSYLKAQTVYEEEEPKPTGLLDQHGRTIVRQRAPIGFYLGKKL